MDDLDALRAMIAGTLGEGDVMVRYTDEPHSPAFRAFLKEARLLERGTGVPRGPSYSDADCREIENLEAAFFETVQSMVDFSEQHGFDMDRNAHYECSERIEEISEMRGEVGMAFTGDSGVDLIVEEGNVDSFDLQRLLPRAVFLCENPHFFYKMIHPLFGSEDHRRLLLPSYAEESMILIPADLLSEMVASVNGKDFDDPIKVRLMKRKDRI